ncbi:MAG: transglutaminase family protein [Pirellulaceae bacterium]|nr:transglutaminase family protein [Pirellulaceae bacterium]
MFFYIKHHHRLKFDSPVFCEPSILRLHPQSRLGVRIHEVRLHLQPEIGELFLQQDVDGNACWKIVFSEISSVVSVTSTSCVEVWRENQAASLQPTAVPFSLQYRDSEAERVAHYASPVYPSEVIKDLADNVRGKSDGTMGGLISDLLSCFSTGFCWSQENTHQQVIPEKWIDRVGGSVIDGAVAFAETTRAMNLPARVVQGYRAGFADEMEASLAAWVELYLPDSGWLGFDPEIGQPVDETYIATACSKTALGWALMSGKYRGHCRSPRINTRIFIRQAAESPLARSW